MRARSRLPRGVLRQAAMSLIAERARSLCPCRVPSAPPSPGRAGLRSISRRTVCRCEFIGPKRPEIFAARARRHRGLGKIPDCSGRAPYQCACAATARARWASDRRRPPRTKTLHRHSDATRDDGGDKRGHGGQSGVDSSTPIQIDPGMLRGSLSGLRRTPVTSACSSARTPRSNRPAKH
jgi:hypothetical protein